MEHNQNIVELKDIKTLADYGPLASRTEKPMSPGARLFHAALGMITENGEFTTEVKRAVIYGRDPRQAEDHIIEELGDWLWYAAIIFNVFREEFSEAENYAHDNWDGRDVNDHLSYCSVILASSCNMILMAMDKAIQDGGNIIRSVHGVYAVDATRQAVRVIRMTVESLTGGRVTLEHVLQQNIDKLRLRFPDAYSDQAAESRADKGGLSARNS